jgi:heme-degrading monooxygenase HmoA
MTELVINTDNNGVTSISTFTVDPGRQDELVKHLVDSAEDVLRHQPGFIGASMLKSDDGTTVVNFAQWESEEAVRAMITKPEIRERMAPAWAIAKPEVRRYTVASVHRA